MKAIAIVRQVPDPESSLFIKGDALDLSSTQMGIDTMDEYGVEEALRLREAGAPIELIALSVGPAHCEGALRRALALGADRAIHVSTDLSLDPISLSKAVAQVVVNEGIELIFTGGRQADWDSEALGAAVAERLGWPQLTWTTELKLTGTTLTGRHDIEEGNEGFTVDLPAVVTTQQGLNEPRFPTLPNLMKARRKELRVDALEPYQVRPAVQNIKTELQFTARARDITVFDNDPHAAAAKFANIVGSVLKGRQ